MSKSGETVHANRTVLYELTKRLGRRLVRCQSRVEDLAFRSVPARLARMLLQLAQDFGERTPEGLSVGLPVT